MTKSHGSQGCLWAFMPPSTKPSAKQPVALLRRCCLCFVLLYQTRTSDDGTQRLYGGGRLRLAIGQQGSNVQNRDAWIGTVKPNGRIVVFQCPLIERLGVLCY